MTATSASNHPGLRLLLFGFLLSLLSSFGHTFFIGLFSRELREPLALGDGGFGLIYSSATLASAASMLWAGALIDRTPLARYAMGSVAVLTAGYFLLPFAKSGAVLGIALFLLRLGGQGLLSHTATTTMARYFHRARGRALSLASLGHPMGEAVLPPVAVMLAASAGWQAVWLLCGAVLLATLPLLVRLCGQARPIHASRWHKGGENEGRDSEEPRFPKQVLQDPAFYLSLPSIWIPGFILTGVFIHQPRLMEQKGWPLAWFAASFAVFAGSQAMGMLGVGSMIDRFNARRLMPFHLVPLVVACLTIAVTDDRFILVPFMAGAGLTAGVANSVVTAMWAETYGVAYLGAVRAFCVPGAIVSTALAPPVFGWMLDREVSFSSVLFGCAASVIVSMILAYIGMKWGRDVNRVHGRQDEIPDRPASHDP